MFKLLFFRKKNNVSEFKAIFTYKQRQYLNDPIGKLQKIELELRRNSLVKKKLSKKEQNEVIELNHQNETKNLIKNY